jgi:hypothetical protein
MSRSIGETAGEVWTLLNRNGPSSLKSKKSCRKVDQNSILQAIGCLAREDKLNIEKKGRLIIYSLKI